MVHPFHYHPLRTDVEFYGNFTFTVDLFTSTVSAELFTTSATAYPQNDEVQATLWVSHTGPAQDVIVSAVVRDINGEPVNGLPLRNLHDVEGWATVDLVWDSSGTPPGRYSVDVELRDMDGHLLDRIAAGFQLGITSAEISAFTATPTTFQPGDSIDISLVISNTGTLPITGTATIEVQTADGVTVTTTYTHAVSNLNPATGTTLDDVWETTVATEGTYRIIGYLTYDAKTTGVEVVEVRTGVHIYLPLVLRNSP
jgi:hypothetical protein